MRFTEEFDDFACDEYVPPVCVCAEYEGAQHPVFCKACHDWTDNVVAWMLEASGETTQQILGHARRIRSIREELIRELAAFDHAEVA